MNGTDVNDFPGDTQDYGAVAVSAQGQITIPKEARDALGLDRGKRLYFFGSPSLGRAWLLTTERQGQEIAQFLTGAEDGAASRKDSEGPTAP